MLHGLFMTIRAYLGKICIAVKSNSSFFASFISLACTVLLCPTDSNYPPNGIVWCRRIIFLGSGAVKGTVSLKNVDTKSTISGLPKNLFKFF